MACCDDDDDIFLKLKTLKSQAEQLNVKCTELQDIPGIKRLAKKCEAELRFLIRLETNLESVRASRLNSSNLSHLQGIISLTDRLSEVKEVLRVFSLSGCVHPLVVDIVCNSGYVWIKVVAKNTKALELDLSGQQEFGEKSVISQAQIYVDLAALHPHNFVTPRVTFVFFHPVPAGLRTVLIKTGVCVCEAEDLLTIDRAQVNLLLKAGAENDRSSRSINDVTYDSLNISENCDTLTNVGKLNSCDKSADVDSRLIAKLDRGVKDNASRSVGSNPKELEMDKSLVMLMSPPHVPAVTKVNLDVTALIALVSNICHGACNFIFADSVLSEQAAEEREKPVLPSLTEFLRDKELTACETAVRDFQTILDTIGGASERQRAESLLASVRQVADNPSARAVALKSSARVTERARIVFGTGDNERAVTVSANGGFVRAASQAGIEFTVFLHSARALTERKEANAKPFIV